MRKNINLPVIRATIVLLVAVVAAFWGVQSARRSQRITPSPSTTRTAPDFQLTNQDDHPVRLSNFPGKVKVITFIYTSCPMRNMCPLATMNMQDLQASLGPKNEQVVLITITFDPDKDSPRMLKQYGELYGADFANWHFLTGTTFEVDTVCEEYGIIHERQDDGTINHSMMTFLVDGDDRIRKFDVGNRWTAEELRTGVLSLVDELALRSEVTSVSSFPPS